MKQYKHPTYLLNIHQTQLHPSANAPIQIIHPIRPTIHRLTITSDLHNIQQSVNT